MMQTAALTAVGIVGILAIGAMAPNVLQLLGRVPRNKHRFNFQTKSVLGQLASKGYINFEQKGDKKFARITDAGKRALLLQGVRLQNSKRRWDKRWRVIMFDIPERRRNDRNRLREFMKSSGFYRLQDSVWVYPHDCEDTIALLKADLRIGNAVLYLIAEEIGNDSSLRQHFGL